MNVNRALPSISIKTALFLAVLLASAVVPVLPTMSAASDNPDTSLTEESFATDTPRISDISIKNDRTMLYVSFRLENAFPDEVRGALQSGIPLTFSFDMEIESPGVLFDSTIVSKTITRQIRYDALKGEYMVRYDLHAHRVFMVNEMDEACSLIAEVENIPLVRLSKLAPHETYILRTRAHVEKEKSSIAFTGMLNIFSSWGFETEWHEVKFNY